MLKSVVSHLGDTAKSGHYEAYTRSSKPDASPSLWLHLDDREKCSITQVLQKSCFIFSCTDLLSRWVVSVCDIYVCVYVCVC